MGSVSLWNFVLHSFTGFFFPSNIVLSYGYFALWCLVWLVTYCEHFDLLPILHGGGLFVSVNAPDSSRFSCARLTVCRFEFEHHMHGVKALFSRAAHEW